MNQFKIIVKREFLSDIRSKSFWLGTFLFPIVCLIIGGIFGYLMSESDSFTNVMEKMPTQPDEENMTPVKAAGMIAGLFLFIFLITYGAMIFNKVKTEKCNRIMEIISTCVDGKTMMLAKITAVGLIGLVQIITWASLLIIGIMIFFMVFQFTIPTEYLLNPKTYLFILWIFLYFIGGYILYGGLYACCGAITDKDNENQIYMTILTFVLMAAFYIGQFAIDNGDTGFAMACMYIPFTSPIVGTVNSIAGQAPVWQTLLSLAILYLGAFGSISLAGKLYRASMFFKGKQFSPKDIKQFLKS